MRLKLGIDVGGTFTDLVAFDRKTTRTIIIKSSTTPCDPSRGVLNAVEELTGFRGRGIDSVVHASTVGTNLFLGQTGLRIPRGALVTTHGFRDVLEIGRQKRPELYNLLFERPTPLVPRHLRYTLRERMDARGRVLLAPDQAELETLAEEMEDAGVETIAVVFLHAYANPDHERLAADYLKRRLTGVPVSVSHRVDPEYREFERTSTTVVNSLLIPVVSRYLARVDEGLSDRGVTAPLFVMQSNGGLSTVETASRLPVATIESGPATGVTAAACWGHAMQLENLLSFDMGGTTAKAGAVIDGVPRMVGEYEVGGSVHGGRTVKGSGYPVRFPFVDLAEVSGGGGTIAWLERGPSLRVGPVSAGAEPGPACYGRGGDQPTVTDANLVLGRLNPDSLSGGAIKLDPALAEQAIETTIAGPLGISVDRAARGIIEIVNQHMMRALRLVSIQRGYDPRSLPMLAFGGSGPMHAAFLAARLGTDTVYVPPSCGVFSAYGLILADFRHDLVRGLLTTVSETSSELVETTFDRMEREAVRILEKEGFGPGKRVLERRLDMRFRGQSYELSVPAAERLQETAARFHRRHREIYGYAPAGEPVEVINARLSAVGLTDKPPFNEYPLRHAEPSREAVAGRRKVYFQATGWTPAPVFRRGKLQAGNRFFGPALVEQYDATTVIPPGWKVLVDRFANLRLTRRGAKAAKGPGP